MRLEVYQPLILGLSAWLLIRAIEIESTLHSLIVRAWSMLAEMQPCLLLGWRSVAAGWIWFPFDSFCECHDLSFNQNEAVFHGVDLNKSRFDVTILTVFELF